MGFQKRTDVLKALALGARGVLVGRPICWGLASSGRRGRSSHIADDDGRAGEGHAAHQRPDVTNVSGQAAVVSVGFDIDSRVK